MSPLDVGALLAASLATGTALGLAVEVVRRGRERTKADAQGLRWHRRHGEVREELLRLREEVQELGYVLADAQRRWGFDLARWPEVLDLVGEPTAQASSRFLVEWAPGIRGLRDGGRATDRVA